MSWESVKMDINSTNQQSGMAPLYPQTQENMKSETQSEAASAAPVEESAETSNQQQQTTTENSQSQQPSNGRVDTYA